MADILFNMFPPNGRISGRATSTFGAGGNYLSNNKDDYIRSYSSLRGKIDGNHPNIRIKSNKKDTFVRFRIRERDSITGNDRSELSTGAFTNSNQTRVIGFSFRTSDRDSLTGVNYLLQIWQPVESPRAGIRINNTNNNEYDLTSRSGGGTTRRFRSDNKWNHVVMEINDNKGISWYKRNGDLLAKSPGGFLDSNGSRQEWRTKFGYYGNGDRNLNVDVKRFVLGTNLPSVLDLMG